MELLKSSVWDYLAEGNGPWPDSAYRKIISDAVHGLHYLHRYATNTLASLTCTGRAVANSAVGLQDREEKFKIEFFF